MDIAVMATVKAGLILLPNEQCLRQNGFKFGGSWLDGMFPSPEELPTFWFFLQVVGTATWTASATPG